MFLLYRLKSTKVGYNELINFANTCYAELGEVREIVFRLPAPADDL